MRKRQIASRIRGLNCAGPGTTSTSVPEAPDGCVPSSFSRRFRVRRRKRGLEGLAWAARRHFAR
eukprot:12893747-Alexandrium_andersonii.AAC.1